MGRGARSTYAWRARRFMARIRRCEECGHDGSERGLEVHHVDGDWSNNEPDNLRKLCSRCHGEADAATRARDRAPCSVVGCEESASRRGRCGMHYMRWYREVRQGYARRAPREEGEIPLTEEVGTRPDPPDECRVEDCERPPKSRGMCAAHYGRWYRRARGFVETGVPLDAPIRPAPGKPRDDELV